MDVTAIGTEKEIPIIKTQWPDVDLLEVWKPHNWAGGRDYRKIKRKKKTCGRPFNGPVQILSDGTVVVCCFDFDGKLVIGDTRKHSIEQILTSKKAKDIKKAHKDGKVDHLICSNCDQLNIESKSPLLYSSIGDMKINRTAGAKFDLGE